MGRSRRIIWGLLAVAAAGYLAWCICVAVGREHEESRTTACAQNLLILVRAMRAYMADYDDTLPPAERWSDALLPYVHERSLFVCPSGQNRVCSYAMNAAVGGLRTEEIGTPVVLLFESDAGWNAAGGPELMPAQPRHFGGDRVGMTDWTANYKARAYEKTGLTRRWLKKYGILGPSAWAPRGGSGTRR